MRGKRETRKNREKKSYQPFLPCLPNQGGKFISAKHLVTAGLLLSYRLSHYEVYFLIGFVG